MSSVTAIDDKDGGPPSKRRRVALACTPCRIRKSRCNGERPKCSLCSNLGFDCQYEPTDSSTNVIVKKEYVSDVESRLKVVEELLRRHDDLLRGHLSDCMPGPSTFPDTSPAKHMLARDSIQIEASDLQQDQAGEEEALTDGMALSFVDEQSSVFFGASSNIAFSMDREFLSELVSILTVLAARHILRAMARSGTQPRTPNMQRASLNGGMLDYSRAPSPDYADGSDSTINIFELPPVAEMEGHISSFFKNTGILFPFIHEPSFMETYGRFKASGFTKVRRSWLGLLNIMMAMGSTWLWSATTAEDALMRGERANKFHVRAVALAAKPSVRTPSLEIVQYLLLSSQYLQGTQKSSQTYTLHGLAVKGAFALGLHSNKASQQFSPLENEIRKRTWFGCVLLDRVLSMTFGRPLSIPEDFIRMPPCEAWPDLTPIFPSAELQQPSMEFFNESISLHRIIGTAIARLYGQNLGYDDLSLESETIPRIFELERDLKKWQSGLPPDLDIVWSTALPSAASYRDKTIGRFRTMLTLRYYNLNILVHRLPLCNALDQLSEVDYLSSRSISDMAKHSVDICLASAEETIDIVHGILTDPSLGWPVLGAWWFTLYYLFNAVLVVFSNSLLHKALMRQNDSLPLPKDIDHLNRAIEAFRLLDRNNPIVDRCTEYVEYLMKIMAQQLHMQNGKAIEDLYTELQQQQQHAAADARGIDPTNFNAAGLPDLSDFLQSDLELAQFFASGIFDVHGSTDGMISGFQ